MFINKLKAIVINLETDVKRLQETLQELNTLKIAEYDILKAVTEHEVQMSVDGKGVWFEKRVYEYGLYSGNFPFRREYLSIRSIASSLSHHIARNFQKENYYTLVLEDDARCIADKERFKEYIDNLPKRADYDIIFLSDCTWRSRPYWKGKIYNNYFFYLTHPYFDISGTHAYIVNSDILPLLNKHLTFTLTGDDYVNECINRYRLRVLVANEVLFTQRPEDYVNQRVRSVPLPLFPHTMAYVFKRLLKTIKAKAHV